MASCALNRDRYTILPIRPTSRMNSLVTIIKEPRVTLSTMLKRFGTTCSA
ncbi:uncharacterized protein G2W53_007489 [Senna tora]|uniref:Uncharacterized protein n=1 Tax=Senna tora TaxID=362788 RepID=A0A834X738_9FABA|nr:uncharacterized protein G2W53_007489 [Senna tora]